MWNRVKEYLLLTFSLACLAASLLITIVDLTR